MTSLARFVLIQSLMGAGIGVAFVAGLMALDVGHLPLLIQQVEHGVFYVGLFTLLTCTTFAGAQVAIALSLKGARR